jgi:hypothetical protein
MVAVRRTPYIRQMEPISGPDPLLGARVEVDPANVELDEFRSQLTIAGLDRTEESLADLCRDLQIYGRPHDRLEVG